MAERVCAALIEDQAILMVHHRHDGRDYWTLPGGAVEADESPQQAAVREMAEETRLQTVLVRLLFEDRTGKCFLVRRLDNAQPALGLDPERPVNGQKLVDVRWFALSDAAGDRQVSKVLAALARSL